MNGFSSMTRRSKATQLEPVIQAERDAVMRLEAKRVASLLTHSLGIALRIAGPHHFGPPFPPLTDPTVGVER
jgi:hypothetical protein